MLVNTGFFSDFCDCKVRGRFCKVRLSTTQKETRDIMYYNLIASAEESTVLAQYVREERASYGSYQSEEALERAS